MLGGFIIVSILLNGNSFFEFSPTPSSYLLGIMHVVFAPIPEQIEFDPDNEVKIVSHDFAESQ